MNLYGHTFHVTPVNLCIYSNVTYIYPLSCLVEIKLFQIVSIYIASDLCCELRQTPNEHNNVHIYLRYKIFKIFTVRVNGQMRALNS